MIFLPEGLKYHDTIAMIRSNNEGNISITGDAEEDAPRHLHGPKCGIHGRVGALFCDPLRFTLLSRLRLPAGRLNTELLCVLGVQSLPAAELHGLGADDASNGLIGEMPIQNIETNVPPGGAH